MPPRSLRDQLPTAVDQIARQGAGKLLGPNGPSFINYLADGANTVSRTLHNKLGDVVSVKDFGAKGNCQIDSSNNVIFEGADDWAAIQAAVNTGRDVVVPFGNYRLSGPIELVANHQRIFGAGERSKLITTTNTESIVTDAALFGVEIDSIGFLNTVSEADGGPTKFHVLLGSTTSGSVVKNSKFNTKLSGTVVRDTHHGGICFEGGHLNVIRHCAINLGNVLMGSTDSTIEGGYIYSFCHEYAIKITSQGEVLVKGVRGILGGPSKGGIWIPQASYLNKIIDVYFGGTYNDINIGTAITAFQPQMMKILGSTFHTIDGIGIDLDTPTSGNLISNNIFWAGHPKQNDATGLIAGNPDIRIRNQAYQGTGVVVNANSFNRFVGPVEDGMPGIGKSYALVVEGAFNSLFVSASNNSVTGSSRYFADGFQLNVAESKLLGNVGLAPDDRIDGPLSVGNSSDDNLIVSGSLLVGEASEPEQTGGGQIALGKNGVFGEASGEIQPNGTLDLVINTNDCFGNPGGFNGFLSVSSTRVFTATQSRTALYGVQCRGTTSSITQIGNNLVGSDGDTPFSITIPSNGVIRLTDLSGAVTNVTMMFMGGKSLA